MKFRTEITELLFELRNRPMDFVICPSGCRLIHKPTKVEIWIGLYPGLYEPVKAEFCWLDKQRFKRAIRGWKEAERRRRLRFMFDIAILQTGRQMQEVEDHP